MGRKKLTIERLESAKARQTKYSKRKKSILKKANEISVLCDVDLTLCMFSPAGKPSLCVGQNKDLHSVIERLSQMSVEDREESQWKYPHTVDDPAKIRMMESHLVKSLNDIRVKKGELFIQEQHQYQQNGFAFEENQNLHV
ncbi:hypothetical protein QYF36_016862 [Acer negundo]|nr:hypothetical protein QYF36_016862 [Acer negundo]